MEREEFKRTDFYIRIEDSRIISLVELQCSATAQYDPPVKYYHTSVQTVFDKQGKETHNVFMREVVEAVLRQCPELYPFFILNPEKDSAKIQHEYVLDFFGYIFNQLKSERGYWR